MTYYGYIIMIIVDSCLIWFHFDCIMQLKKSYHIATNVCSRTSATTFGDLLDCIWSINGKVPKIDSLPAVRVIEFLNVICELKLYTCVLFSSNSMLILLCYNGVGLYNTLYIFNVRATKWNTLITLPTTQYHVQLENDKFSLNITMTS